ncbi:hypothetical protein ABZS39_02670, partial [Micromonospora luteifusca]
DGSGKLDDLLAYRPGSGIVWVLQSTGNGDFWPQIRSSSGIGSFNLAGVEDRLVPFDYDGSGKLDDLLAYRPGSGIVWVLQSTGNGDFWPQVRSSSGIGTYDLTSPADQIVAFDFDHVGSPNYLLAYRPGKGAAWIGGRQG